MDYTVYTIGGGEFLVKILKGMTALSASTAYISILKIMVMFGLFWMLLEVSFMGKFNRGLKWFFTMFFIFNILFLPKVAVIVEDKLNPQLKDNIIGNVPFGVAVVGHYTSLMGDKMTELTETAYNSGMDYNKYGLLASVNVSDAVTRAKIIDPDFNRTIRHFMKQCVFWDIALKKYPERELLEADDMWEFLGNRTARARSFVIYDSKGADEIIWCIDGVAKLNNMKKWDKEVADLKTVIGSRLFPHLPKGEKDTAIDAGVTSFAGKLFKIAGTAEDAIKQAMLINSYKKDSMTPFGSPMGFAYAQARSETQTKLTYDLVRKQAQSWLPVLRGVLQGILYGAFPLVLMLMLLPIGVSVAKSYFGMFVWIESWGPIYAIINSMLTTYAGYEYGAETGGTLTAASHAGVMEVNQNIASVAGNMMMFIPFIAGGLMWGARSFTSLATSMLSTPMQTASEAAREVSTGNISLNNVQSGNMSYNNLTGNKMNDSVMVDSGRIQAFNSKGGMTSISSDGRMATDYTGSYSRNPGFDTKYFHNESSQLTDAANATQTAGIGDAIASQELQAKGLDSYVQGVVNQGESSNWQDGYSHTLTTEQRNAMQNYQSSIKDWAKSHGVSTEKAGKIFASVSANKLFKGVFGVGGGIEGSLSQSDRKMFDEAQKYMESTNFEENKSIVEGLAQKKDYTLTDSQGNNISYTIGENFKEASQLDKSARANFERAEGLRKEASYIQSEGYNITQDLQQPFMEYLREQKGVYGQPLTSQRINQIMTASEYGDKDSYILREQLFEDFMRKGGKKMADQHQLNQGNVITDPSVFNNRDDGGFSFNKTREDMNNTFNNNQGSAKNPENIINAGSNIKTATNIVENAVTPPPTNKDGDQGGDNVVQGGNSNQTPSAKEVNDSSPSSNVQVQMPKALQELGMPKYASRNVWNEMFNKFAASENPNKQSNDVVGDSAVPSSAVGSNNDNESVKGVPSWEVNAGVGGGDVAQNTNNKNDHNSDPYEVKETERRRIQEKMIQMNRQNELKISPRRIKNLEFINHIKDKTDSIVLDFESVINLDERTSYFNDEIRDEIPKICIIGCINLKNNIFKVNMVQFLILVSLSFNYG